VSLISACFLVSAFFKTVSDDRGGQFEMEWALSSYLFAAKAAIDHLRSNYRLSKLDTGAINSRVDLCRSLTGLLQLAAFSFRTIKSWSGFGGDF
jgi:hypothetical protein